MRLRRPQAYSHLGLALAFLHSVFDFEDDAMQQWPSRHRALISRWVHLRP